MKKLQTKTQFILNMVKKQKNLDFKEKHVKENQRDNILYILKSCPGTIPGEMATHYLKAPVKLQTVVWVSQ